MKIGKFKIRKRWIIAISLIIVVGICSIIPAVITSSAPKSEYVVVIDAGHGARDGGCIGVNGTIEKDIKLEYAKTLKKYLENRNVKVVMTRTKDEALYEDSDSNKKSADMRARAKIIRNVKPDLVVSIHMNSFSQKSATGARVYHKQNSEVSKSIADLVQKSFYYYCNAKLKNSAVGDYYILNCTDYTSILIECGYLSNVEEEAKLNTKEYKEKLMFSAFSAILVFLGLDFY